MDRNSPDWPRFSPDRNDEAAEDVALERELFAIEVEGSLIDTGTWSSGDGIEITREDWDLAKAEYPEDPLGSILGTIDFLYKKRG